MNTFITAVLTLCVQYKKGNINKYGELSPNCDFFD